MASYELSRVAEDDIARIYRYGLVRYGETQADTYFFGLHNQFEAIADNPNRFPLDDIRKGYRRAVYEADVIYFRVSASGTVEIMAVLGRQDREAWL